MPVKNKYMIWISIGAWILAVLVLFATQGNEIANVTVLLISFWILFQLSRSQNQPGRI